MEQEKLPSNDVISLTAGQGRCPITMSPQNRVEEYRILFGDEWTVSLIPDNPTLLKSTQQWNSFWRTVATIIVRELLKYFLAEIERERDEKG